MKSIRTGESTLVMHFDANDMLEAFMYSDSTDFHKSLRNYSNKHIHQEGWKITGSGWTKAGDTWTAYVDYEFKIT